MKKILMIIFALAMVMTAGAQETAVKNSNVFDNWYVGLNGGMSVKTTHTSWFNSLNPEVGARIGKNITPVWGFAFDGTAYLDNSTDPNTNTFVRGIKVSLLQTVNFMNLIGGYNGTPRRFEVIGLYGIGWGHRFGTYDVPETVFTTSRNILTSKFAIDAALNLGSAKAWQIYLEPSITYGLTCGQGVKYNLNHSAIGLTAGVIYKFKTSNGTHNFVLAKLLNEEEWNRLNDEVNELRSANENLSSTVKTQAETIKMLTEKIKNAKKDSQPARIDNVVNFKINSSKVDPLQIGNLTKVVEALNSNRDAKITVSGYADANTGTAEYNQKLSEQRAQAVKDALVRLGADANQISTEGCGSTHQVFGTNDLNRVAIFVNK